jgi:hypothetical protein
MAAERGRRIPALREEPEEEAGHALLVWRRLVRKLQRLRRLQRIFAYVGQHLQTYAQDLRDRLRAIDPPPREAKGHGKGGRR